MTEEGQEVTLENPVIDEIVTPQTEEIEAKAGDENAQEEKKSFTQAELDKIIQKEKAKAEAKAERRALKVYAEKLEGMTRQPAQQQEAPRDSKPTMAQFTNVEDYVEAVADWKLAQRDEANNRNKAEEYGRATLTKTEKMYAEATTLSKDFDRASFDELPLTPAIAQAIIDSDIPAKIMVHLSSNPDEADRIARLSPARQAAEIGKMEAKLAASPAKVKASNAPDPIKPVGARNGATNGSLATASMDDYIAMRKQQGARWAR